MTSQEFIASFYVRTNKDETGNISVDQFVTLANRVQEQYQLSLIEGSPELSTRVVNGLSPFLTAPFYMPLTDGIGTYNANGYGSGDFVFGPYIWLSDYTNPKCGEQASPALVNPVEPLTTAEWGMRTISQYKGATLEFPIFQILDDRRVEVMPHSLRGAWVKYIRKPRPITIATVQNGSQTLWVDQNAVNDNPEWSNLDCNNIISRIIGAAGLREGVQSWMAEGERSKQQ